MTQNKRIIPFFCFGAETSNLNLVYHVLRFWKNHGVESFRIVLQSERESSFAPFEKMVESVGFSVSERWLGEYRSDKLHDIRRRHFRECEDGDWVFLADSDELPAFPGKASKWLESLPDDVNFIQGMTKDRIAADYTLKEVTRDESLVDQFPLVADLTKLYVRGDDKPVIGIKKGSADYHGVGRPLVFGDKAKAFRLDIHHFKWDSLLELRLKRRIESYRRLGFIWVDESVRVMENVRDGRLLWRPDVIEDRSTLRNFLP